MAPSVVAVGTAASGTASITPVLPTPSGGFLTGDVIIGVAESFPSATPPANGTGLFPTIATNGFAHVSPGASPVTTDTQTILSVVWCRWTSGLTAHAWGDAGDHGIGAYIVVRGCPATGNPWSALAVVTEATLDTSAAFPGVASTVVADTLVLEIGAWSDDFGVPALPTNSNYTGIAEHIDAQTAAGNDGSIYVASGVKATIGATGSTAATLGGTARKAMMTLVMQPAVGGPLALTASGTTTSGGTATLSLAKALTATGQTTSGGAATVSVPTSRANTFEGITNGAAITNANSGTGGDAISGTGGTAPTATTTSPIKGSTSASASASAFNSSYLHYDRPAGYGVAHSYLRTYFRAPNPLPSDTIWLLQSTRGSDNGNGCQARMTSAGAFQVTNASDVSQGTTTATVAAGQVFRLEIHHFANGANNAAGQVELRLFTGAKLDSPANDPTETLGPFTTDAGPSVGQQRAGLTFAAVAAAITFDDLAISNTTWPGPTAGAGVSLTASGQTTSGGTATVGLAKALTASGQTISAGFVTFTLAGPPEAPDAILAATNLSGPVGYTWAPPAGSDPWIYAPSPASPADIRFSFPTPATAPGSGGPVQFQVEVRRTTPGGYAAGYEDGYSPAAASFANPTVALELWEAGSFVRQLTTAVVTSTTSQMITGSLNPAELSNPSGADVELRVRTL